MAFLIFIFLFVFFPKQIFAAPNIEITDFSSNSDPEWVMIINNDSLTIDLTGWYFLDKAQNKKEISGCIFPGTNQIFTYSAGWLNNTKSGTDPVIDIIYVYQKDNSNPIDTISYTEVTNKTPPESTNTCALPTSTPTPAPTATNTPTLTNTPTPDPTITNPSSGISLTEFMPYTDPEWIEIYNNNDYPIKLVSWKIQDSNGNSKSLDLSINSKSYGVYELKSLIFNNNDDEKVILLNQNGQIITETSYSKGLLTTDKSWSNISGSWCQTSITKGYENVTSCASPTPTSTPTITIPTPTPTSTKYIADENATASAIIEPQSESAFLSPTSTPQPTPTIINGLVLGETTSSSTTTKKNYLPLIFIIFGGILLVSPVIIDKVKSKK